MISCDVLYFMHHKVVEWFEMMSLFECEHDNKFLQGMITFYARIGEVDIALRFYDRAKKEKSNIDKVAFSALIKMYGKLGNFFEAKAMLNEMIGCGFEPNILVLTSLAGSYGKAK